MIDRLAARVPAGLTVSDAVWAQIEACYGEEGRHYHNLLHLCEVAERFAEVAQDVGWSRPAEVFVAVLYHDAIYEPGRSDNEARSATLAREHWDGPGLDLNRVAELIELTATHGKHEGDPTDSDAKLFLDCDMAILAAEHERFAGYDADVAREYLPIVSAEAFAQGRAGFLESVLASPRIFLSDYFHQRAELAARGNLGCALAEARFDAGAFWQAHDAWEPVWKASEQGPERQALQGLIQCAAALVQQERGRPKGARRLLDKAIGHFGRVTASYRGIDLHRVAEKVAAHLDGSCEGALTLRARPQ